jgi:AraC-like DNA-binding protein
MAAMQPVPLVRASVLGPLFEYLERAGLPCEGNVALARTRLRDPLAVIPLALGGALWEEASRTSELDDLGLRVGAATPTEHVGALAALVRRAPTIGAAIERAVRHSWRFNTGERYLVTRDGDEVTLQIRLSPALRHGRRQACDFVLMLWVGLMRLATDANWRPLRIHFEGAPPRDAGARAELAVREVLFEQPSTALVLSRRLLTRSLPALDPEQATALARDDTSPHAVFPDPGFAGSARQLVGSLLQLGSPDVADAAHAAGASVRTFQRRLSHAGLSFSRLLEEARRDAAQRMLLDPGTRIIEISGELGYSDAANFTRAFRRWTGLSPRAFRRSVVGGDLAHRVGDLRPGVQAGLVERGP